MIVCILTITQPRTVVLLTTTMSIKGLILYIGVKTIVAKHISSSIYKGNRKL